MCKDARVVDAAAQLRRRAGLSEPSFSTAVIVSASWPDAIIIGHTLPGGVDEVVSRTPMGIVIAYRRGMTIGERRFAIAHAIGHLSFDDMTSGPRFRGRGGSPESEERADAFAAELLVPTVHLEQRLLIGLEPDGCGEDLEAYLDHVDQLASLFKVTAELIDQRIRELIL